MHPENFDGDFIGNMNSFVKDGEYFAGPVMTDGFIAAILETFLYFEAEKVEPYCFQHLCQVPEFHSLQLQLSLGSISINAAVLIVERTRKPLEGFFSC